jgi:hypothetical protein
MPYSFNDASLLSYSLKKKYVGEGEALINATKSLVLKGFIDNTFLNLDNDGVKENFNKINELLSVNSGQLEAIIINGINFGTGKVISAKFPKENPIRFGEYEYEIEIYDKNDFSFLSGDKYGSYLPSYSGILDDLSEQINFSYNNGKYSYDHDLSIQFKESDIDYSNSAKNFASGVFSDNVILGLCGKFSGYFNNLKNKKSKFKETYDDINLKYSFNKKIEIDQNYSGDNFSKSYNYALSFDNLGKISIIEKGEIYSLSAGGIFDASGILENEIAASNLRCNNIYNSYISNSAGLLGSPDTLYTKPVSINRIFEKDKNYCSYSVQYINDPRYNNNLLVTKTSEYGFVSPGVNNGTNNLDIVKIGGPNSFTNQDYLNIKSIVNDFTGGLSKIKNYSFNFVKNNNFSGNSFQFSFVTTTDPDFTPKDKDFIYLKVEKNLIKKPNMFNEYQIPNHKDMLILDGKQKNISEQNITINGVIKRVNSASPYILPNSRIKEELIKIGLDGISKDACIEPVTLKYNSNYQISASIKVLTLELPNGLLGSNSNIQII